MADTPHRHDTAPATAQLIPLPDGPYQVTGPLEIAGPGGAPSPIADTAYLCRCGLSADKPWCDGSHARAGWRANP